MVQVCGLSGRRKRIHRRGSRGAALLRHGRRGYGGQAKVTESFAFDCVVERGGKGARLGRRPLQEVEGHQEFVEVETVVFEGVFFEGVLLEAEGFIEADGGEIGADDGEEDLFDFGAGGVKDGLHEEAGGAGAAIGGADVHGAEPAFVRVFAAGVDAEGDDADELGIIERRRTSGSW